MSSSGAPPKSNQVAPLPAAFQLDAQQRPSEATPVRSGLLAPKPAAATGLLAPAAQPPALPAAPAGITSLQQPLPPAPAAPALHAAWAAPGAQPAVPTAPRDAPASVPLQPIASQWAAPLTAPGQPLPLPVQPTPYQLPLPLPVQSTPFQQPGVVQPGLLPPPLPPPPGQPALLQPPLPPPPGQPALLQPPQAPPPGQPALLLPPPPQAALPAGNSSTGGFQHPSLLSAHATDECLSAPHQPLPSHSHSHGGQSHSSQQAPHIGPVENYIPFRYPDLRDQIVDDFPKVFAGQDTVAKFFKLCRWLSARNTLRLTLAFGDVKDKYAYVDPDNDTMDPGAGIIDASEKGNMQHDFEHEFLSVLDKGEFDAVTPEDLTRAQVAQGAKGLDVEPVDPNILHFQFWFRGQRKKMVRRCGSGGEGQVAQGAKGLDVEPVDPNILHFQFWFRGQRKKMIKYSGWKTGFQTKETETTVYQRLALLFKLKPEDHINQYLEWKNQQKLGWCGCCYKCSKKCCKCFWTKGVSLADGVQAEQGYVYLKLFKDVDLADLDMLLPGAKAKFTWFDMGMIWGPIIFGVGAATYKAASGTLRFDGMMNILLSLVLIVMPLTWGFKAYLAVKDKMQQYQAYLNNLCLTHNLDNNAGVVSGVLDEAQEQEDNEAMLAYFFLWRGMKAPTPMSKLDLDIAVEAYLSQLIKKQNLDIHLDFEVCDSIGKLESMGLLGSTTDPTTGATMLQVLPLDEALEQAHVRHFDEKREVVGVKAMGRLGSAAITNQPPWRECESVYPATGQRFRYFYNVDTGESTYTHPDTYVPLSPQKSTGGPAPGANGSVAAPAGTIGTARDAAFGAFQGASGPSTAMAGLRPPAQQAMVGGPA